MLHPKKWVCAVSRSRMGQITFPHLIIPRHRNGAGLNFTFPHKLFRRISPNFGIAGDRFWQQVQSNLGGYKRGLAPEELGFSKLGSASSKNIFCDHRGRVGDSVFYKIPPWGGQNQTCKRVKETNIYGVPKGGQ